MNNELVTFRAVLRSFLYCIAIHLHYFSLSGTLSFHDVMYAGGTTEMEELNALQQRLQFDDPINIQFTSVCINHHV